MTWKSSFFMCLLLLQTAQSVLACACCGVENTWHKIDVTQSEYINQIVSELRLTNADFILYPDEQTQQFTKVTQRGKTWTFFAGKKLATFVATSSEHQLVDVSFTQATTTYPPQVLIYHQIIMQGEWVFDGEKQPAKLILQGSGNACVDQTTFKRWILKTEQSWVGSGDIVQQQ